MKTAKTILLVDDDEEDQEIFEVIVNEINPSINCICVDTGEDALKSLLTKSPRPDCIFLDLNLPFMNGFECLDAIKKNSDLKNIPVYIYSTSNRHSDIEKAEELGASRYFRKLNTFTELKNMLSNVFE